MAVFDVYSQYFEAEMTFGGVERKAALVTLTAESEAGNIRYTAGVTFFPHKDEEDYEVSYDAYFEKVLFGGKGRRSKKKDEAFLNEIRDVINELTKDANGKVFWDKPLRDARYE